MATSFLLVACGQKDLGSSKSFLSTYNKSAFNADPLVQIGGIKKNGKQSHKFSGSLDVRTQTEDSKLKSVTVSSTNFSEYSVAFNAAVISTEKGLKVPAETREKISKKLAAHAVDDFQSGDIYISVISTGDDARIVTFSAEKPK